MSIKDVRGIEVRVGDTVAFAGGGRGASEFYCGEVIKITNKGVKISYEIAEYKWDGLSGKCLPTGQFNEYESQRNEGMFAILDRSY